MNYRLISYVGKVRDLPTYLQGLDKNEVLIDQYLITKFIEKKESKWKEGALLSKFIQITL